MLTIKHPGSFPWSRCTTPARPISGKNQIGYVLMKSSNNPMLAIDSVLSFEFSSSPLPSLMDELFGSGDEQVNGDSTRFDWKIILIAI